MADNPKEDMTNPLNETEIEDNDIIVSKSALSIYMQEITKYPILSLERQKELAIQMNNGSSKAREELINCNLRLVVHIASKYFGKTKHLSQDDLISEGNAGLIRATQDYNPEKGAFTTYATNWIKSYIQKALYNKDALIRKPIHYQNQANKYNNYIRECEKNGQPIPDDQQICKELDINPHVLKFIKNNQNNVAISINQKIGEDQETELQDLIPSYEPGYEKILNNAYDDALFIVIKNILSPIGYYTIYHRFLSEEQLTLEHIAYYFNITRERVRQIEKKSLEKIKPYMTDDGAKIKKVINIIREKEKENFQRLKKQPLNPIEIIRYLYVKDDLTPLEADILYLKIFDKYTYTTEDYALYLKEPIDKIKKSYEQIRLKIAKKCADQEAFQAFVNAKIKSYGASILRIKPIRKDGHLKDDNRTYTYLEYYETLDLNKIFANIKFNGYSLNSWGKKLVTKYFLHKKYPIIDDEEIVADINLVMFNYKHKDITLSKDKLQEGCLKITDELSDEEISYLASYYFNTSSKDDFISKYPESCLLTNDESLISKIERSYYSILKYFDLNFTKEMYLLIRDSNYKSLGDKRVKILDMYFGVNGPTYSPKEIALKLNLDYEKFLNDFRTIRQYAIELYTEIERTINIDKKLYSKYVTEDTKCLLPIQKDILRMFIIENKTYAEISTLTNLTPSRISMLINQAIHKIDVYSFGVVKENFLTENDVNELLKLKQSMLSPLEIAVIQKSLLELKNTEQIATECNINYSKIFKIITKFNNLYIDYLTNSIILNNEDIQKECKKNTPDSVLTKIEKQILSFYYGFKNDANFYGLTISPEKIQEQLEITKNEYNYHFSLAISKLKQQKAGHLQSAFIFNSRQFIEAALKDKHLPISIQLKEIFNYLFALNGYPYLNFNELATKYHYNPIYLIKIIYQAFIQIFKYQANEIEGQPDYVEDILPNLKYFTPYDRAKINDYYLNGLTIEQIAQKYHLSYPEVYLQIRKIKITLKDILKHHDNTKLFDFDYYQEAIKDPLLPFRGDLDLTTQIFALFFGMDGQTKLSISEIKERLNLDMTSSAIQNMLYELMISVYKLQDGITKERTFTISQICSYYITNYQHLTPSQKQYFLKCIDHFETAPSINCQASNVPALIISDLIKDIYPKSFSFNDYTARNIIQLIKKYQDDLNDTTIQALMFKYNIQGKEFMTDKEITQFLEIFERITLPNPNDDILTLKKNLPNV